MHRRQDDLRLEIGDLRAKRMRDEGRPRSAPLVAPSARTRRLSSDSVTAGHRTRSNASLPTTGYGAKEMCQITKRTHFVFYQLSMERFYLQELVSFADAFANGFVLEKRSHFLGDAGIGKGANAMAWGIFELMRASSCSKGCWCRERCFDKSRNPAGSRRTTGLSMTDWEQTNGRVIRMLTMEGGVC